VTRVSGGPPIRPLKLSERVFLAVEWPEQPATNRKTLPVRGRVDPGSRVLVQGRRVGTAVDGSFETEVALRQGSQSVSVSVTDLLGRNKSESRQITMDPNAPDIQGEVRYRYSHRLKSDPNTPDIEGEVRYR
jgi:glucodextranase-like protein